MTTIKVGSKIRILVLRPTGELWPIGTNDIQFIMPESLVSNELSAKCWNQELLQLWRSGHDIGLTGNTAVNNLVDEETARTMIEARRKVGSLLRRVLRETERMASRLTSGTIDNGRGGGMEAVWDAFAREDDQRSGLSAVQVAEYLLNPEGVEEAKRITVRPNTLPAYAAHTLLMRRPDLFVADDRRMWDSSFLVRSRSERARFAKIQAAVENKDPMIDAFVAKAKKVRDMLAAADGKRPDNLPEWSQDDLDLIWMISLPLIETRSTQTRIAVPIAASIMKAYDPQSEELVKSNIIAPFLLEIGVMSPGDSLARSIVRETADRSQAIASFHPATGTSSLETPTPADAAIDSLRSDIPYRVYVIDDADAKELDDGIAVERVGDNDFWLHTTVADPTRFLARDSDEAMKASHLGTSVYLAESTIKLLPEDIGGGDLSLGLSSQPQGAMVFSARVDREGNIHDTKVSIGWLKNAVVTTYNDVNAALEIATPRLSHPFGKMPTDRVTPSSRKHVELSESDIADLTLIKDLTDAVRAKRYATAGFEYSFDTASNIRPITAAQPLDNLFNYSQLPTTPQAYPQSIAYDFSVSQRPPIVSSQNIVAEAAILANRVAAKFCAERNIAVPFRGGGEIRNSSMTPADLTIDKLLEKRVPGTGHVSVFDVLKANYFFPQLVTSTTPQAHWFMGIDTAEWGYVRATSPLRRYDDMLVHWQIKAALAAEAGITEADKLLQADEVMPLATRADIAQLRAKVSQTWSKSFWEAGLLRQQLVNPGVLEGTVRTDDSIDLLNLEATPAGPSETVAGDKGDTERMTVHIPALGMRYYLDYAQGALTKEEITPGHPLRVKFTEVTQYPNPVFKLRLASA